MDRISRGPSLPFNYYDYAPANRWLEFLNQILEGDQERIDLIHESIGYFLLPDTSLQRFWMLCGEGAKGKSVLLDVITALLGPENVSHVPLEIFGERFQMTPTLGKLVNIATEIGEVRSVAEGHLKAFSAGDRMYFDRKGIPGVHAKPTAWLILATNNLPQFADRSTGIWRRMILVPFNVVIPREQQDPLLAKKIIDTELNGIFNLAVQGLRRLRERGTFTEPAVCRDALKQYREDSNPARSFLVDHVHAQTEVSVSCEQLYSVYEEFCRSNGHRPLTGGQFGKEIRRQFPQVRVERPIAAGSRRRVRVYQGIELMGPRAVNDEGESMDGEVA